LSQGIDPSPWGPIEGDECLRETPLGYYARFSAAILRCFVSAKPKIKNLKVNRDFLRGFDTLKGGLFDQLSLKNLRTLKFTSSRFYEEDDFGVMDGVNHTLTNCPSKLEHFELAHKVYYTYTELINIPSHSLHYLRLSQTR
jgi:hypothetical protein